MPTVKRNLTDIASMGKKLDPVARIYVTEIFGCKNISEEESTVPVSPETQTYKGIELEAGKVIIKEISEFKDDIIIGANSISGAGTGGLNFPGGGANAKITGTFRVTNLINADGGITLGANMTTGSHWIRGSGGAVGQKFTGANVEFSGSILVNNNIATVKGYINCGNYIISTNSITSGGYVKADIGAEFRHGINNGISTIVDFNTYNGILTFSGGILTNKS